MRRQWRVPFFYGWVLVAIGFLTMAVGVNARTAFSLLFPPILRDFVHMDRRERKALSFPEPLRVAVLAEISTMA